MSSPPEVVPTAPATNEGSAGLEACDPTYHGAPRRPPSEMPAPASTLAWGSVPPPEPKDSILELEDADLELDADSFAESQSGVPREFEPVDAPMLELDLEGAFRSEPPPAGASSMRQLEPVDAPTIELADVPPPPPPAPDDSHPYRPAPTGVALVEDGGEFWSRLPLAFVAPVLGRGWVYLLVAALAPLALLAILRAPIGFIGRLLAIVPASIFFLGLLSETFARVAQCGADNDRGTPRTEFADTAAWTLIGAGVASLFAAGLLFVLPVYFVLDGTLPYWALYPLAFVPYVYWPMALTAQGLTGEILAVFDVPRVVRGIVSAPLAYLLIVVVGFALITAISVGVSLVAIVAGLSFGGGAAAPYLVFGLASVGFLGLTYFHGVTGYAMGRLVATHPRLGDVLTDGA